MGEQIRVDMRYSVITRSGSTKVGPGRFSKQRLGFCLVDMTARKWLHSVPNNEEERRKSTAAFGFSSRSSSGSVSGCRCAALFISKEGHHRREKKTIGACRVGG